MTYKELEEKATPGEWYLGIGEQYCFHSGNRVAMCVGFEEAGEQSEATIAEFWPADKGKDIIDAKLLLHCKKHFGVVVEALKTAQSYIPETAACQDLIDSVLSAATNIPDMGKEVE